MIILGIETSCDETAASLLEVKKGKLKTLSNIISSQVKLHAKWGGVVPNLAAREHLKNIAPVLKTAFKKARVEPRQIDLIAVTQGPGLIPALLIGTNAAKTLSYVWQKPLIGIHHIEGHIYANFVRVSQKSKVKGQRFKKVPFPILCLVVSGGHTQLVLMKKHLDYEIIGQTLDDAVGEAFDKVARILGLGYPGGPAISQQVAKWKSQIQNHKFQTNSKLKASILKQDSKFQIKLPRPMINSNDFNFSFSGLKTAVLYLTRNLLACPAGRQLTTNNKSMLACEFQQAAIDVLIHKTTRVAQKYNPKTIMLAGGVSANKELRKQLGKIIKEKFPDAEYLLPDIKYSTDNAAMIASAGYYRWKNMSDSQRKKALRNWQTLQADANLKLA